jgi:predicted DNA binding protein
MRHASLVLRIPHNWISEVTSKCQASIKVLRCVPADGKSGRSLLKIDAPAEMDEAAILNRIMEASPSCEVSLTKTGPGEHLALVRNDACMLCSAVMEAGCFLDTASSRGDGRVVWNIIGPSSQAINSLVNKLKDLGCEVEVSGIRDQKGLSPLTYHQERAVRIAYDLGYYDIPRKITLDDLASKLGITKATLDIILRRAERKLISRHTGRL